MKKLLFIVLMLCMLSSPVHAALTYGASFYTTNKASALSGVNGVDPLFSFITEMEGIVEDANLEDGSGIYFDNGGSIDNILNNDLAFRELSEDLRMRFSTNAVTLLSRTGVLGVDFNDLYVVMDEISAPAGAPASNKGWIYIKDGGGSVSVPYFEDAAGTVTSMIAGAGTPAGADTQFQYNNNGAFGEITTMIWDDTNIEFADDQDVAYGTNADWLMQYDEGVDDQLLWITAGTAAAATTDPMYEILVGATPTADQQVFGIGKGTQASNTALFTVDEDGDGEFAGNLTLGGAFYQAAIAAASAGNVALTVDGSGNGTIGIGTVSTGAITLGRATTLSSTLDVTGATGLDGAVTLGDAAADSITITGDVVANVTLDDDTTDSPSIILRDAGENDWIFLKANGAGGHLTATADSATSSLHVVTGNLEVGTGAPGSAAMDGEDFYVKGDSEFDGAVQFDGLPTGAAGLTITGAAVSLNTSSNFAANICAGTSTGTVTIGSSAGQIITIGNGAAAKTVSLGSSNTTSTTTILGGSNGVNINVNALNDPTNINTGVNTGTVTIGGTGAQSIAIGDGGTGAKIITIGDAAAAGSTTIKAGTGNLAMSAVDDVTLNGGSAGSIITIGGNTQGNVTNISVDDTTADAVTIGSAKDTCILQGIAVTIGSTGTTSTTTINAGSGEIQVVGDFQGDGPTTTITGMGAVLEAVTVTNTAGITESGSVFTNTGDGDGSTHVLPEASTALGCSYTYAVTAAFTLNINPADGTDQILGLTDGAGDSIQSAAVGDCITLMAVQDDIWVVVACNNSNGNADAWADAD